MSDYDEENKRQFTLWTAALMFGALVAIMLMVLVYKDCQNRMEKRMECIQFTKDTRGCDKAFAVGGHSD